MVDLHIHSNYSDGELTVNQIIDLAKQQHLKAISITDHYSIAAHLENKKWGIELISGIEISVEILNVNVHLIGLLFDAYDIELNRFIKHIYFIRYKSLVNLSLELNKKGIVTPKITKESRMSQFITEVYRLNENLTNKYIKETICNSNHYIKYRKQVNVDPQIAIQLLHKANGLVIIPHINRLPLEKKELIIEKLVEFGVDGIETIYPTYTENDVFYAKKLCEKYNLLESGGSDYHSQSTKENQLGFNPIPDIILKKMQEKREKLD